MRKIWLAGALGLGLVAASACTNDTSGGGGGSSSGGASSSSGSGGTETFSCTVTSLGMCTQLLIPSSGSTQSTEQAQCTGAEGGTAGTGCATTGIVGCCQPSAGDASHEEQCYYSASAAQTGQLACPSGHTWSTTM